MLILVGTTGGLTSVQLRHYDHFPPMSRECVVSVTFQPNQA